MLSAEEARQLERFSLGASAASPAATMAGLRFARARGFGVEFQDFRAYQPGDDPRSIDWNIEARLRQLVVRVFRAEGHIRLHLLVDVSASMALGTPSKLACAKKIAAALCYIAVSRRDDVGVAMFDETLRARVPPAPGRAQLFRIFDALGREEPAGRSAISRALVGYGSLVRGPGLVVVLSDFYDPAGCLDAIRYLAYRGLNPAVVQVVADDELQPDMTGPAELYDIEDSLAAPVVIDSDDVAAYQSRMAQLSAELEACAVSQGLPWLRVSSSAPFDLLLDACVQAGLVAAGD
jgi:uncharacterized protein (DUF58 family)